MRAPEPFDSDQVRAAERRVTDALAASDVTASYGTAIWNSGRSPDAASTTRVPSDGVWRIALEAFLPLEAAE